MQQNKQPEELKTVKERKKNNLETWAFRTQTKNVKIKVTIWSKSGFVFYSEALSSVGCELGILSVQGLRQV